MLNQKDLFTKRSRSMDAPKGRVILPASRSEASKDVFAEAILDDSSARQRRSPLDWVVSIGIHAAILVTLLILPLYFTNKLDLQKFDLTYIALPPAPPAPPPPPLAASAAPRAVPKTPIHFVPGKLTAPSFIPPTVAKIQNDASALEQASAGVPGGVAGGVPGGQLGGVFGGVAGGDSNILPPPPPTQEAPRQPVHVGGNVKPPRLLYGPTPEYPILAKQARISGTVVIDAIIDERGNVEGMRAVSGPPLLVPPALAAVAKRKYEPTVLNGVPTPIDLRVDIDFQFS